MSDSSCVLLVANDPVLGRALTGALERLGTVVKAVDGVAEAVSACEAETPDLVVLIDAPPAVDAVAGCEVLKPHARVLVLGPGGERREQLTQMADAFLVSPPRLADLQSTIPPLLVPRSADEDGWSPEVRELLQSIRSHVEGWGGISGSWSSWKLAVRQLDAEFEAQLKVVRPDGTEEDAPTPRMLSGLTRKLRFATVTPAGAWFSALLTGRPGQAPAAAFDYSGEPAWTKPIRPTAYAEDLERFPRRDDAIPAWLRERLDAASAVPDPLTDLRDRLSDVHGRSPSAVKDGPGIEERWAWHGDDGVWHVVGYGCSDPSLPAMYDGTRGAGYEFTVAWEGSSDIVPSYAWSVVSLLTSLTTREWMGFTAYSSHNWGGPLGIEGAPENYQGFLFVPDPLVPSVSCAEGAVQPLRAVPLTVNELEQVNGDAEKARYLAEQLATADSRLVFHRWSAEAASE